MHEQDIPSDHLVAEIVSRFDGTQIEEFNERAGIREFDALLPRTEAEALAALEILLRYPAILTGVSVLQAEIDGATHWLLSSDSNAARRYLVDTGGTEISAVNLADVIVYQYGGLAMLATVG